MKIFFFQDLFSQFLIVRQLSIEGKTEPTRFGYVVSFERLSITPIILAACRSYRTCQMAAAPAYSLIKPSYPVSVW